MWHELLNVNKSGDIKLVVETANELVSQEPPKFLFLSDYSDQKTVILDEDEGEEELECVASGIPKPMITWVVTYFEIGKNCVGYKWDLIKRVLNLYLVWFD